MVENARKNQGKMRGRGVARVGKQITLVISNGYIDNIIKAMKSLENLDVLTDGVRETVKHKIKRQEDRFISMLLGTLGLKC